MRRGAGFFAGVAAKSAVSLLAVAVLGMAGYGWVVLSDLTDKVVVTDVLSSQADGDRPMDGTVDILLVGVDSRTDARGHPLSREQRRLLWVDRADGEVNTDTIILLHIPKDTSRAVAVSIPRDSYVDIPGYGAHKINSAYPRGKNVERRRLQKRGNSDKAAVERWSNQAGARVLIKTVEQLTGRTIDHYAAVNLMGFYGITQAIGGVEVCLRKAVEDERSNADFPAGRQVIAGKDVVSFVRQRHGLPRGDLDRVVRQQVFLTGMARKVLSAGTLSDPGRLTDLMEAISRSVVLSRGWDIMAFAKRVSSLTGGQLQFRTIPVGSLALQTPQDGAAVEVDPHRVRQFIAALSGPSDREVRPQAQTSTSPRHPTTSDKPAASTKPATQSRSNAPSTSRQPADDPITADEVPCVN
ncbi:MAG: LCP family protein [Thermocrispum sp.]